MLKPRESVKNLKTYHPPLGNREGLRLDFNENTVGCSPRVMECLRHINSEQLAKYPEREPLEALVAAHLKVRPEEMLLTNGTDEAIHLICETYLEPGDEAIIVVPTFSMYEIYAAATGAKVVAVPAGEEFCFPAEDVLARISERTRLIAVANPNNPTGTFAPLKDLRRIISAAPHAAILIDEAYFEFCGETMLGEIMLGESMSGESMSDESMAGTKTMDEAGALPNLFVARTFSKAYGLAGLRIGVLAGNAGQMPFLRAVSSPYNVNSVALACLPDALADEGYIRKYVKEVLRGRDLLETELQAWNVKYWPSRANFVLMYLGDLSRHFIASMRGKGILVRDRSSDPGCAGCVRITLGSGQQTGQMLASLREVFEQMGIRGKVNQ